MLKGVHLTLMIGPAVPVPAPKAVTDALQSVQVTSSRDRSGFQLTFAVSKTSPLLTTMLPAGYFDPMITRVIVIATVNGFPNVLMDGIAMNIMRYPAMPEIARIYLILAKYLVFGIVPIAIPPIPPDVTLPTEEIATHRGTDREYIRLLAQQAGYVFYVEPGPLPGQSIAYFGPDIRIPVPQPALNVNMDAHTNVESLSVSLDGLAKKILIYTIMDPATHKIPIPIPLPNLSVLRPPLGARLTPPSKVEFVDHGTAQTTPKAIQEMLGITNEFSNAVSVSGSLDVLRYGRVLRSRMLVGVRGASIAYDGLYYVDSVTHNVKRGEYKQSFQLSRDGLISLTPKVPA